MRVYVELPDGWGPGRAVVAAWERAGYDVAEVRSLATGRHRMVFVAPPAGAAAATQPADLGRDGGADDNAPTP